MEKIREILEGIVWREFGVETTVELSPVPEGVEGDFATNVAMKIAKGVGMKPREIAERLVRGAREVGGGGLTIEIAGPGFLNITLGNEVYKKVIQDFAEDFFDTIKNESYKGKKVVTEFSDPNPFKVLHVGHLYTSVMGESISRLVEFGGGEVHRVNFGGDVGLHVAKTLYAIEASASASSVSADALLTYRAESTACSATPASLNKLDAEASKEGVTAVASNDISIEEIAEAYVRGTRMYEEDEGARRTITELNKKIYQISERGEGNYQGLSEEDKKLAERYWKGREASYKYFEQFYDRIGVKFEKFYPESSVVKLGEETVYKELEQGVYEKSEGAIVFRGEKFGLHTRVFINKEGVPTYETKDVGLLFTKYDDYEFDESVVITGNEQSDYMKVVLKSVEQYAPELVERTKHITHGMVRLPGDEKMSSRKGNFIKAVDIIDDVCEKTENEVIALAAIKYAFLKYKIGGNIVFDADESVSTTGNSGVYLLYSAVRAGKILAGDEGAVPEAGEEYEYNIYEKTLIKKFMEYPGVLEEAIRNFAPHLVATYLFEIAQEFSRFYEKCRVRGDEHEGERLWLVRVFREVMEHGLFLLGIVIPEEM